jgi:patatin-related protein
MRRPRRSTTTTTEERRHRNVFHFTYCTPESRGEDRNDFRYKVNPFLAFAARCTSAFPFAFEPMRLADIDPVLNALPGEKQSLRAHDCATEFADLFPGYEQGEICLRAFGDGGYLDNKPFGYATDTLVQRHAELPVARKLIYIEPAPEHPELEPLDLDHPPDFIQNVLAALTLPSYETIREDLQRVIGRNRFIGRVDDVMRNLENDARAGQDGLKASVSAEQYIRTGLKEMIHARGTAYGAYHRLKVESVTDDLARLVTHLIGFDEASDEFRAVRYFLKAWRLERFGEEPDGRETETAFLMRYDLGYRGRRLEFLRAKINDLNRLDRRSQQILEGASVPFGVPDDDAGRDEFRRALGDFKKRLSEIYRLLRITRHRLASDDDPDLLEKLQAIGVGERQLAQVLAPREDAERLEVAGRHVRLHESNFQEVADAIAGRIEGPLKDAAALATGLLGSPAPQGASATWRAIQQCLWHYYQYYEDYDFVRFPILYCTDAGEAVSVDVIRISPEDTTTDLVNGQPKPHKLGGASLAHFGAFLEKAWRKNDIMWGRLDTAERLITTLWPDGGDETERQALIDCAHKIILAEELQTADRDTLYGLLACALAENAAGMTTLVGKIPRSRRWRVTAFGHRIMGASVRLRQLHFPTLYAEAA